MADISIFNTRAPYHITTYGLLTGTQFFQSFIGGIVAYKALSRPQFSQLQQKIFPVYFSLQTALPAILFFTYPGSGTRASGLRGVLNDKWGALIPLAGIVVTSTMNLLFVGPATTKTMRDRKVQETRDGKKYTDSGPHSVEMQKLNTKFGALHSASSFLNLISFVNTLWYGFSLAARIQ